MASSLALLAAVSNGMTLFMALQNLTGTRYQVDSSPGVTVGRSLPIKMGARLKRQ